jgi:arginyl-tRNA synthetase
VKTELARLLVQALQKLEGTLVPSPIDPEWVSLERTRDPAHGDFASNVAMRLAKLA